MEVQAPNLFPEPDLLLAIPKEIQDQEWVSMQQVKQMLRLYSQSIKSTAEEQIGQYQLEVMRMQEQMSALHQEIDQLKQLSAPSSPSQLIKRDALAQLSSSGLHLEFVSQPIKSWYQGKRLPAFEVAVVDGSSKRVDIAGTVTLHICNGRGMREDTTSKGTEALLSGQHHLPLQQGCVCFNDLKLNEISGKHYGSFQMVAEAEASEAVGAAVSDPFVVQVSRLWSKRRKTEEEMTPDDPISQIEGIGRQYISRLEANNIKTVRQLALMGRQPEGRKQLLRLLKGDKSKNSLNATKFNSMMDKANTIMSRHLQEALGHKMEANQIPDHGLQPPHCDVYTESPVTPDSDISVDDLLSVMGYPEGLDSDMLVDLGTISCVAVSTAHPQSMEATVVEMAAQGIEDMEEAGALWRDQGPADLRSIGIDELPFPSATLYGLDQLAAFKQKGQALSSLPTATASHSSYSTLWTITSTHFLHVLAFRGDEAACHKLVDGGVTVDVVDASACTALWWAASNGHSNCCHSLLSLGANVNHTTTWGATPLMVAVLGGHAEVAGHLMQAGGLCNMRLPSGMSALHLACHLGHQNCLALLLNHGAISHGDTTVGTPSPLALAALGSNPQCVSTLCSTISPSPDEVRGALETATLGGCTSSLEVLLPFYPLPLPKSLLSLAAWAGHADVLQRLLSAGLSQQPDPDSSELSPFHLAAAEGADEVVRVLMQAGGSTLAQEKRMGVTPLEVSVYFEKPLVSMELLGA